MRQEKPNDLSNTQNYVQKNADPLNYSESLTDSIKAGLGIKTKINGVIIDDDDNIVVLHDNNIISIFMFFK